MIPATDYLKVLPEIVLSVFGMLVMVVDPLLDDHNDRKMLGVFSALGVICALCATFYQAQYQGVGFFNMVRVDHFSIFFHVVVLLIALATILMSFEYLNTQNIRHGEYYALILLGAVGMCLMSSAIELVLIFVALEISSIATYILAGFRRRAAESAESSLKYFLLGSFATAFFLYGVALMFGATGSTNVDAIAVVLRNGASPLMFMAVALMFVGLGFKVAAAPFQIWTPDVYEGAPAPVTGLMSTGPKAAAFAVLLRVLFATWAPGWFWLVWVSAALSMTLGNFGAAYLGRPFGQPAAHDVVRRADREKGLQLRKELAAGGHEAADDAPPSALPFEPAES
ncbi:MAG TPA: NADH-quinone oxidoreductase subunit N, partial [Terriglobales bacterium]